MKKKSLFIQEHTHMKQHNSNPSGDVYRTVLHTGKGVGGIIKQY